MPRKTKEQKELELKEVVKTPKNKTSKKSDIKEEPEKISVEKKSRVSKKAPSLKKDLDARSEKKSSKTTKSATRTTTKTSNSTKSSTKTTKKTSNSTKSATKTATKAIKSTKSTAKKATSARKSTSKQSSVTLTRKTLSGFITLKGKFTRLKKKKFEIVEYYDLPYRYNQTIVKILAQTPKNLFIYWDISDQDRENYKKEFGENFFETTKPVLIVHNDTLNYSFEVEINDFANSWYLHVNDSKCDYRIELGRRPIYKNEKLNTDYIYISMSNKIESPNDKILFDVMPQTIYFRNVKTGQQTSKSIFDFSFIKSIEKLYNIYDFYKLIYKDENIEKLYDLSNPSSGNPSSRKFIFKI